MKNIGISLFFLLVAGTMVFGQSLPLTNQYLINKYSLSPSYAGSGDLVNIFAGYRNQWTGIKGAPLTRRLSISSPLWPNVGVGGEVISDQAGFFNRLYLSLSYAYHLKLADEHTLSFGLAGKFIEHSIDLTNSVIDDINDPIIQNRITQSESAFNAGASLLYQFKGLNIGAASPFIMRNKSRYNYENNIDQYLLQRHFLFHASYDFIINDNFGIEPFAIFRLTQYAPVNYEFAALFKYKGQYWLGASYRREGALGISAGLNLNNLMVLNYTYELLGTNKMTGYSNGTHEINLGVFIGKGIKKMKKDILNLTEKSDSLAKVAATTQNDLKKAKEEHAKDKEKMTAKLDLLQQRLEELELEMANVKTLAEEQQASKQKEIDEELADIEKKLKEVGGQFFVVVEAFKIPENARKAIELWALKGLEVKMIYNEVRDFYYIYVGKYATYNDALKVKNTLKENGIFGWIYLWK
ncbi:MAG: PorP/SprF family type IX secretion system membrane protein [Sphingobacteriales bacterium]|nr:PorP/SprF family type IX secretion system membrane protein [Sphingobacteriales bacterium]